MASGDDVEINIERIKAEMARFDLSASGLAEELACHFRNGNYESSVISRTLNREAPVFVRKPFVEAFVEVIRKLHQEKGLASQLEASQLIIRQRAADPTDHGAQLWEEPNKFSGPVQLKAFERLLGVFREISDFLKSNIHFTGYTGYLPNLKAVVPPTSYTHEQKRNGVYGFIIIQFKGQFIPIDLTVSYRHWIKAPGIMWGPVVNYGQIAIERDGIQWWEIWKQVEWPKLPIVSMDIGKGLRQIAVKTWLDCDDDSEPPEKAKFFIHGNCPLEHCYMTLDSPPPECPVAEFPPGVINRKSNMWLSWSRRKLLSEHAGQPPKI